MANNVTHRRRLLQQRSPRRAHTTLWVTRDQHAAFRHLVKLTGLQTALLLDRLLQLGRDNVDKLLVLEPCEESASVRATGT